MGLDAVELVMAIEEEFGIEFSDAEAAQKIETVCGMHLAIVRKLRARCDETPEPFAFEKLRDVIVEQIAGKPEEVVERACFVRDLGFD